MRTSAAGDNPSAPERPLTVRELEVLALTATGARTREIAAQLELSEATIKTHLVHVYRKLGVPNRVAASTWYLEHHGRATQRPSTRR
jgi:DNA-binding CsgD family transcriptional regulator